MDNTQKTLTVFGIIALLVMITKKRKLSGNPVDFNGVDTSLYEGFHQTEPARTRKIGYEPPNGVLVKIGRVTQINYRPEEPSKRKNSEYYHKMGDTGEKTLKSNTILATDRMGNNLYLLNDKQGKYPKFTDRGIIG